MTFDTFKPRHYMTAWDDDESKGVMQRETSLHDVIVRREGVPKMNETILRLAQAEYERQFPGQDYERMQERGGLGVLEVVRLLADYVERLGGKPTEPRKATKTS